MNVTADLIQIVKLEFKLLRVENFTYRHWTVYHLHIRFIKQDLLGTCAEGFDLSLLNMLTPLELLNPGINVECSTTFALRHYS